jgi:hypothetical protein
MKDEMGRICSLREKLEMHTKYRVFLNKIDAFTALLFTAAGAPPAAKGTRILPMTQHADNIWNEGTFLPLFTDHRRC